MRRDIVFDFVICRIQGCIEVEVMSFSELTRLLWSILSFAFTHLVIQITLLMIIITNSRY